MPQSYTNLIYHIVFSTKNRQPLITDDVKSRLYDYIGGTIRKLGGIALAINGMDDPFTFWQNSDLINPCQMFCAI